MMAGSLFQTAFCLLRSKRKTWSSAGEMFAIKNEIKQKHSAAAED